MAASLVGVDERAALALETIEKVVIKVVEEVKDVVEADPEAAGADAGAEASTELEDDDQIFADYESLHERLNQTLYYGYRSTSTDRLSLAVTELSVNAFNLHDRIEKLDRLDMSRASQVTRETCASPTSLVLALMYLERLRTSNPGYLTSVSSADLFLVSLMVASKWLHDDGEEDEVFNEEWAKSGGMDKKDLNRLELEFLVNIDWRLHHTPPEFEAMAKRLESAVAKKQLDHRGWNNVTYCDMVVLTRKLQAGTLWDMMVALTIKMTAVFVAAYAASLVTMMGTCHMLNHVKLGPNAVSQSINTIYKSLEQPEMVASSNPTSVSGQLEGGAEDPEDLDLLDVPCYNICSGCDVTEQPLNRTSFDGLDLDIRLTTCCFLDPAAEKTASFKSLSFDLFSSGKIKPPRPRTKWNDDFGGWFAAPLAGKV